MYKKIQNHGKMKKCYWTSRESPIEKTDPFFFVPGKQISFLLAVFEM